MGVDRRIAAGPGDPWDDVLKLMTEILEREDAPLPGAGSGENGLARPQMPRWNGFLRQKLRSVLPASGGRH